MKKLILLITLFSCLLFSQEYEKNKVRIKISSDSEIFNHLINNQQDAILNDLLGDYKVTKFIPDNLIEAYKKAYRKKHSNMLMSSELEIENIFDFEYSNSIDAQVLSSKIEKLEGIIYAEPIYKREFIGVPNDTQVSEQYHHSLIKTFEAWDLIDTSNEVVIGIVDTGIEFTHEDLKANIWNSKGETGKDSQGKDKSSNGIDDDDNGYIDDWRGWDIAMNDNDPSPGHTHGTHVAGIASGVSNNSIGISGVAKNFKLAAIKVGYDSRNNTGVVNGYQGLLYAAMIGCDVINCSWGGGGGSKAEESVITSAVELGPVIVCAAGNNGSLQAFYPAAHNGVISVASTTENDTPSGFSNFHPSVDVSAPGSNIFSTVLDGKYDSMSGTSMASPVAAGVAALIVANYPQYTNQQVIEHIMATSDNIENNLSPTRKGNFGKGRVNALNALSMKNVKLVRMTNYTVTDLDGNNVLEPGDELNIEIEYSNKLSAISGLDYNVIGKENNKEITLTSGVIGDMAVGSTKTINFKYTLPENIDYDFIYQIPVDLTNNNDYTSRDLISFTVNQSFRTLSKALVDFTLNSKGNIGYNDYPANEQGVGITYGESESLMYEGAIMLGAGMNLVASSARSSNQNTQDNDFYIVDVVKEKNVGKITQLQTKFSDKGFLEVLGVDVKQSAYYVELGVLSQAIILEHTIYNSSSFTYDSLFAGYYFDWDISMSGRNDIANWDAKNKFMIQKSNTDPNLPHCALAVLSNQNAIGYALDNDGEEEDNPGVYDGFSKQEKWKIMSGAIKRTTSNITDCSSIISAGPVQLKPLDSVKVNFVIMFSDKESDFPNIYTAAKEMMGNLEHLSVDIENQNFDIYPNPTNSNYINFEFINEIAGNLIIKIVDMNGNIIKSKNKYYNSGKIYGFEEINGLSNGVYNVIIESPKLIKSKRFIIKK